MIAYCTYLTEDGQDINCEIVEADRKNDKLVLVQANGQKQGGGAWWDDRPAEFAASFANIMNVHIFCPECGCDVQPGCKCPECGWKYQAPDNGDDSQEEMEGWK